jgi:hypothetical protein
MVSTIRSLVFPFIDLIVIITLYFEKMRIKIKHLQGATQGELWVL